MNKGLIFCLLILSILSQGFSQTNRYMVFFSDKSGENYPYSLEEPEAFLTDRAIQRRASQGINLSESDLPVNPEYVSNLKEMGLEVFFSSKWFNAVLIQAQENEVINLTELNFIDSVALVANNQKLQDSPSDFVVPTSFKKPSSINSDTELQLSLLQADVMHNEGINGQGMLIAVLDNGFKGVDKYEPFEHLWNDNRIVATKNFVDNSGTVFSEGDHGTAVFSTMSAKYEDIYAGVAFGASYILCVTEENGSEDRIEEFNWTFGAEFADSLGVDIINSSLGYVEFDIPEHTYQESDLNGNSTIVSKAAKLAAEKGMLVVVSAGNNGDDPPNLWRNITPPADAENMLAVASVDENFNRAGFTSLGYTKNGKTKPDVAALGVLTSIIRGSGSITFGNGTSYSSPQIAGLAAGIWQQNPEWSNFELISAIKSAGHKSHKPDTLIGNGVPIYSYAVEGKILNVNDIIENKIDIYPNPFHGKKLFMRVTSELNSPISIQVHDSSGKSVLEDELAEIQTDKVYEFSLNDIDQGVYYLTLQFKNERKVVRIVNYE